MLYPYYLKIFLKTDKVKEADETQTTNAKTEKTRFKSDD